MTAATVRGSGGSGIAQESEVESWNREMRKCGALVVTVDSV